MINDWTPFSKQMQYTIIQLLPITQYTLFVRVVVNECYKSHAALNVVISNAFIVDPMTGIVKADVGIKGNKIVDIG